MRLFNQLILSTSFVLFSLTNTFGQLPAGSICLGNDTTVCQNQPVTIVNCNLGAGSINGTISLQNPTNVFLSDDQWSAAIPMGFSFSFYGNTYTSCLIGSNGLISFNLASAGLWCPYAFTAGVTLPTTTVAGGLNSAMLSYQDLLPTIPGTGPIQYETIGTAPNRKLVVLYAGVGLYGSTCANQCNYMSIILHETTNNIEFFISDKGSCPWNGNISTQGTMNSLGTIAHITPGRNNVTWTTTNDGQLFTPTSPTNTNAYTITPTPYIDVISNNALNWKNTLNQSFPYNGTTNSLTVTNPPAGTTGYFLSGTSGCQNVVPITSDTTWITSTNVSASATSVTDTCSQGVGTVTATPGIGTPPFTYSWPTIVGGNTATVNNVGTGTYSVQVTDANGCTGTTAVAVQNLSVSSSATSTLVSCTGGSDGTATATMTPNTPNSTYLWSDPAAQTTQTAIGLSAGTYTCTITNSAGCVSIATVIVSEIPGITATIVNQVDVDCHAANTGIITLNVTDGTAPYTYVWSGSTSTGPMANDLFVGPHSVDVTDANGCLVSLTTTLAEPLALYIDSVATDSIICSESSIVLGAVGAGGSTAYIYTWYENGTQISNAQYVTVDPVNSGTQYKVVLSEVCGSPTTADSLILTFPTDIVPMATPIPYEACAPDSFLFTNTSTNAADIASTVWQFSNGTVHTIPAQNSVKEFFEIAGMYDANMIVTSVYGCIYTNDFPQIISALQRPRAQFGMTTNPTTIFETKVGMIDKSVDASQWAWTVPMGTPNTSTLQFPEFNFPPVVDKYEILLLVTSPKGCTDTTRGVLDVQNDFILYAPNSFTPDGDQFNQNWHIVTDGLDINDFELSVYNRWGEAVWQSLDPSAEWDGTYNGKIVPSGNYNWKLRTKKSDTDEPQIFTGSVMIIR